MDRPLGVLRGRSGGRRRRLIPLQAGNGQDRIKHGLSSPIDGRGKSAGRHCFLALLLKMASLSASLSARVLERWTGQHAAEAVSLALIRAAVLLLRQPLGILRVSTIKRTKPVHFFLIIPNIFLHQGVVSVHPENLCVFFLNLPWGFWVTLGRGACFCCGDSPRKIWKPSGAEEVP